MFFLNKQNYNYFSTYCNAHVPGTNNKPFWSILQLLRYSAVHLHTTLFHALCSLFWNISLHMSYSTIVIPHHLVLYTMLRTTLHVFVCHTLNSVFHNASYAIVCNTSFHVLCCCMFPTLYLLLYLMLYITYSTPPLAIVERRWAHSQRLLVLPSSTGILDR